MHFQAILIFSPLLISFVAGTSITSIEEEQKTKNMTLAIVSLDTANKLEDEESLESAETINNDSRTGSNPDTETLNIIEEEIDAEDSQPTGIRSVFACLTDRPLWRLFLVMTLNGLFSLGCAALIIKIEKPAQDERYKNISEKLGCARFSHSFKISRAFLPPVMHGKTPEITKPCKNRAHSISSNMFLL